MSRTGNEYSDHLRRSEGGTTQIQPEKCQEAKIEKAAAFLAAQGFTVVATTQSNK